MQLRKDKYQNKHQQLYAEESKGNMESMDVVHLNEEGSRDTETQMLEQAIAQLGVEQRKCIELFYLKKLRYVDVAKETRYSLKEVKSYIQNGKRNLKLILLRNNGKRA